MQLLVLVVAIFSNLFARHLHKHVLSEKQISLAVKSYITDSISTLTLVLGILWPGHNTLAMSFLAILCILLNLASTWSILMVDSFNSLLDTAAAKKTLCAVIGINFIAVLIVTKSFIQIFTAAT